MMLKSRSTRDNGTIPLGWRVEIGWIHPHLLTASIDSPILWKAGCSRRTTRSLKRQRARADDLEEAKILSRARSGATAGSAAERQLSSHRVVTITTKLATGTRKFARMSQVTNRGLSGIPPRPRKSNRLPT